MPQARHPPRLILLYNAESGFMNAVWDSVQKIVSPGSYQCALCALSHGTFTMRGPWRAFLKGLPLSVEEYHRDEFASAFPEAEIQPAAILIADSDAKPRILVSAEELDAIESLDRLIEVVERRLKGELSVAAR